MMNPRGIELLQKYSWEVLGDLELLKMKKSELIHYIRSLEDRYACALDIVEGYEKLAEQQMKKTMEDMAWQHCL